MPETDIARGILCFKGGLSWDYLAKFVTRSVNVFLHAEIHL